MREVFPVRLELLRTGRAHSKVLSRETDYLALCGDDGPVTIRIPFDQHPLLNRLARLRYAPGHISEEQRQAELIELGTELGSILADVPALNAQLWPRASTGASPLVHLQLMVWGAELALVPFELATAPAGFPGSARPLLTQVAVPVTLTRGVRLTRAPQVEWDRPPRILFAWAQPQGVGAVPFQEHLDVLGRTIEPWVRWRPNEDDAAREVKERLTVIPNASIESIRKACIETRFTHVHILAHGLERAEAGERRYGIALHQANQASAGHLVSGTELAQALEPISGHGRPTVVTLATCDAGNVGSPLIPGGSIAHDLHASGIPWVIASQLPLTIAGSVVLTDAWYSGILRGDDPRWVLHEVRRQLSSDSRTMHDWASLVTYAVTPHDFEAQVHAFRSRQTKARVEVLFEKAERMSDPQGDAPDVELVRRELIEARRLLACWRDEVVAGNARQTRAERAERLGLSAAAEKRIALLLLEHAPEGEPGVKALAARQQAEQAMSSSLDFYRQAFLEEWTNFWVLTQFLSLSAVHANRRAAGDLQLKEWWTVARWMAERQRSDRDPSSKAWALANLAELELLGFAFGQHRAGDTAAASERVADYCRQITDLMGGDSFHVRSTRRQFERYATTWSSRRPEWREIAAVALDALPQRDGGPYSAAAG